ncbi:MAG: PAC2 family protein, partial [Acidobacteria bacterium]|nr:PAC2 family protein [Acidobacteriota bacterium]
WTDPDKKRDIVVFLGEAQPPIGKYVLCHKLVEYARELGVERIFTFAAMATQMHPEHPSRVFGAATDENGLQELKRLELEIMQDGHIGGLNGVLLGVAAESGLPGICLLGEMPHIFSQLPFPKGSQSILEVFTSIAGIEIDFAELQEQSKLMEQHLGELLARVEKAYGSQTPPEEEGYTAEPAEEEKISADAQKRIDELFAHAEKDRSKAFELKRELDRLGVFKEYEDRFLDLFKK